MEALTFVVEISGQRLDAFLAEAAPGLSRSRLKKLIEEGQVTVEGKPAKPSRKVLTGEVVRVLLPDPALDEAKPEDLPIDVLYEDDYLVAVAKPAGMVVHPAPGHAGGTMVNALLYRVGGLSGIGGVMRPGIVHRLDKDTSGVLLVAKDDATHRALQGLFKERELKKTYLAVVAGKLAGKGVIESSIGRHPVDRKRMASGVRGGRMAVSRWKAVAELKGATLLEVVIETGRTHQIRVHLASIGHPVAGDPVYSGGGRSGKSVAAAGEILSGQALHAWRIEFIHPITGESLSITAPLPLGFRELLARLGAQGQVDRYVPAER